MNNKAYLEMIKFFIKRVYFIAVIAFIIFKTIGASFAYEELPIKIGTKYFSYKIIDTKNELNANEKRHIEKLFNYKYKIMYQLGDTGWHTSAYLMEDGNSNKYVLKIPNDINDSEWIKSQKKTYNKIKRLLSLYSGNVQFPNYICIGENFVIEEYLGEELSAEFFETLSEVEKNHIERSLAHFINFLTKTDIDDIPPVKYSKLFYFYPKIFSLDDCFNYLKNSLTKEEQNFVLKMKEDFLNRNRDDEINVLTHCDLRGSNILYNKSNKKLAIIDFELLGRENIYYNFVPHAASKFNTSYNLLAKSIDYYNKISACKISKKKVELWHKIGSIYEICVYAKFKKNVHSTDDIKKLWHQSILPKIKKINLK